MSPRFAQFVDPIFERVLDLLMAIEEGRSLSAVREWTGFRDLLRNAEHQLHSTEGRGWELSKFALAAWIDESLRNTDDWSGREWVLKNSMEYELFKTAHSHEMFFVNAKEAASLPNGEDSLETYYVCAMLGFRGFYGHGEPGDPARIELVARKFGLPLSFVDWARETGTVVRDRRRLGVATPDSQVRERRIVTAKPFWSRAQLVWPWLLATLFVALNAVVWYHATK